MLFLARSRVSKKINLLPLCRFIHSNQMLICRGFHSNCQWSQSYNHKESLGNESLGVCFACCIRKGKNRQRKVLHPKQCSTFGASDTQWWNSFKLLTKCLTLCKKFKRVPPLCGKEKIYNFNFVLSIPTSKHPLAPSALYQEEVKLGGGQLLLPTWNMYHHQIMCAWLSRSARELSHVHSRQKRPRTGNRRTRKTMLFSS